MYISVKKIPMTLATIAIFFAFLHSLAFASNAPPVKGEVLPDMKITVPQNAIDRSYLGLERSGVFTIPQIKATIVIVEIFSILRHCNFHIWQHISFYRGRVTSKCQRVKKRKYDDNSC